MEAKAKALFGSKRLVDQAESMLYYSALVRLFLDVAVAVGQDQDFTDCKRFDEADEKILRGRLEVKNGQIGPIVMLFKSNTDKVGATTNEHVKKALEK